jgi:hypothetical protein
VEARDPLEPVSGQRPVKPGRSLHVIGRTDQARYRLVYGPGNLG